MIKMKLLLNSLSKRFQKFTNDKYDVRIKWLTGKKLLLNLKISVSIQLVKFIKEFVFEEKHTSEKLFPM